MIGTGRTGKTGKKIKNRTFKNRIPKSGSKSPVFSGFSIENRKPDVGQEKKNSKEKNVKNCNFIWVILHRRS